MLVVFTSIIKCMHFGLGKGSLRPHHHHHHYSCLLHNTVLRTFLRSTSWKKRRKKKLNWTTKTGVCHRHMRSKLLQKVSQKQTITLFLKLLRLIALIVFMRRSGQTNFLSRWLSWMFRFSQWQWLSGLENHTGTILFFHVLRLLSHTHTHTHTLQLEVEPICFQRSDFNTSVKRSFPFTASKTIWHHVGKQPTVLMCVAILLHHEHQASLQQSLKHPIQWANVQSIKACI